MFELLSKTVVSEHETTAFVIVDDGKVIQCSAFGGVPLNGSDRYLQLPCQPCVFGVAALAVAV